MASEYPESPGKRHVFFLGQPCLIQRNYYGNIHFRPKLISYYIVHEMEIHDKRFIHRLTIAGSSQFLDFAKADSAKSRIFKSELAA